MAPTFKWILISIITLCSGIWIGQKLESSASDNYQTKKPQNHFLAESTAHTFAENAQLQQHLQQQIQQLQTENLRLKKQLQAQTSSSPSGQHTSPPDTTENDIQHRLQILEMEKQQRKAADIVSWITEAQSTDNQFNLNAELEHHFEQENRDIAWAERQEGYYRQIFSEQDELQGIALRDTQCRSTQCAITIGIANIEQSNQLIQTISKSLAANGQPVAIMIAADERAGTSKLYISNNENSFDFN